MDERKILIVGANGQLGRELQNKYPGGRKVDIGELNIADTKQVEAYDWDGIDTIINAAAYTNVDGAETNEGRVAAWHANTSAVRNLIDVCLKHGITLVHISTEYVFDGSSKELLETEPFSPLSVYGSTKAAADILVSLLPKYYILRTSWVIGGGKNFVRTMIELGQKGINPTVIDDNSGRPTFTAELVRGIDHLLVQKADFGTYNISNEGKIVSWAELTRAVFRAAGLDNLVTNTTDKDYYAGKENVAKRPLNSVFNLDKLHASGFVSRDWQDDLEEYIKKGV